MTVGMRACCGLFSASGPRELQSNSLGELGVLGRKEEGDVEFEFLEN